MNKSCCQQRFCAIAALSYEITFLFPNFVWSSRANSVPISATVAKPQDVSGNSKTDIMKSSLKLLLLFMFIFLSGCSVRTDLFVQNYTNEDIMFKIVYNQAIDFLRYKDYTFRFENGIVDPKSFLKSKSLKVIEFQKSNDSTLLVKIPKNSTARIEATSNMLYVRNISVVEFADKKISMKNLYESLVGKNTDKIYKIE